jgi:hypothetical protein
MAGRDPPRLTIRESSSMMHTCAAQTTQYLDNVWRFSRRLLERNIVILVTSAYGNQGRILIPKLHSTGQVVRALRITPGRDHELGQLGVDEVLAGDASDRSTLQMYYRAGHVFCIGAVTR